VSLEAVERVRAASRALLADDLQPRPDIDVSTERVEVTAAPETPPSTSPGAAVIPIR
jgi:hypothetical protein